MTGFMESKFLFCAALLHFLLSMRSPWLSPCLDRSQNRGGELSLCAPALRAAVIRALWTLQHQYQTIYCDGFRPTCEAVSVGR